MYSYTVLVLHSIQRVIKENLTHMSGVSVKCSYRRGLRAGTGRSAHVLPHIFFASGVSAGSGFRSSTRAGAGTGIGTGAGTCGSRLWFRGSRRRHCAAARGGHNSSPARLFFLAILSLTLLHDVSISGQVLAFYEYEYRTAHVLSDSNYSIGSDLILSSLGKPL